jgi:hypothetical protein
LGVFGGLLPQPPEVWVGGFSVPKRRNDYRVSLDTIYVDLDTVPEERKQAVSELFEQMGRSATNTDAEGWTYRGWWT